ncbi:MAG: chemotaxis protein CheD [Gammaproteobacteria bacterium]|nr:chemotaxis protein CheD [Gammaproteobacteria bacterium]MBQ0840512.1 chemotaxis protein CheD [Gammaproteobacteria bacterium]
MNSRIRNAKQSEVFLHPGDFYFSAGEQCIGTLLGSCIAICLWHPILHIGGMCHFVLPDNGTGRTAKLNGRYAIDAMKMFVGSVAEHHTELKQYQASIYGGANVVSSLVKKGEDTIGERNAAIAMELLMANKVSIGIVDVGESWPRRISFDVSNGQVTVNAQK